MFSPDRRTLAVGASDGTVRLWDIADPANPQLIGQPLASSDGNTVEAVAFSPDGHILAGGYLDGTVRLWNVADPAHPRSSGQPLPSCSTVNSVAFSPDGHTLAGASTDGITRLWNLNVHDAIERICAAAGDLKPQQWHVFCPSCRTSQRALISRRASANAPGRAGRASPGAVRGGRDG